MALPTKLQALVKENIISLEQAEKIIAYEQSKKNSLAWKTMFIIAGLLIGLGIILVVSSNWEKIPNIIKLIGNYSIFAAIIYGIYWCLGKNKNHLQEFFITLAFLMVGESIGLNGQIFHLSGGWESFATFWAILSIPFILFSRMTYLNTLWIILIIIGLKWHWLYKFWHETTQPLFFITLGTILLGGISYLGMKLYNYTNKKVILPKALASFSVVVMYVLIIFGNEIFLSLNYSARQSNLTSVGMYIVVFVFLGIRMALAYRNKNISSFKNNSLLAELYIFYLFVKQFDDLWLSGIGFILGGILLLVLMHSLRKTAAYIKRMEALK